MLKKLGNFVGNYFCHFMSLYSQTSLENNFFSALNWIDVVFCLLRLLEFLFKAWFPLKSLVFLKLFISTNDLIFLYCMCLINATRKNSTWSLLDKFQFHNNWKSICVFVWAWVGVCNGNTFSINSLKAEDKVYWDKVMCKWIFLQSVFFQMLKK